MRLYRPRNTQCLRLLKFESWAIKVYTITNRLRFNSNTTLRAAIAKLPEWLEKSKNTEFEAHGAAFLIVHEGTTGVWTHVNWWADGEILQTLTFHTDFETPHEFSSFSGPGFVACVWEMGVIAFERGMWIEHVLRKAKQPDFDTYLAQTLEVDLEPVEALLPNVR